MAANLKKVFEEKFAKAIKDDGEGEGGEDGRRGTAGAVVFARGFHASCSAPVL
jgi:hypothetical protein